MKWTLVRPSLLAFSSRRRLSTPSPTMRSAISERSRKSPPASTTLSRSWAKPPSVDPIGNHRDLSGRQALACENLGIAPRMHGDELDVAVDGALDPPQHADERRVLEHAEIDRVL